MNCPRCKQANAVERNFCGGCGAPLAAYCAVCGFRNVAADHFCGGCGRILGSEIAGRAVAPAAGSATAAKADAQGLSELLDAALEELPATADDAHARVNQDDIDALFQD